jgi:hypothetical protein
MLAMRGEIRPDPNNRLVYAEGYDAFKESYRKSRQAP